MSDERFAEILNELQARGDKQKLMQLFGRDAITYLEHGVCYNNIRKNRVIRANTTRQRSHPPRDVRTGR